LRRSLRPASLKTLLIDADLRSPSIGKIFLIVDYLFQV